MARTGLPALIERLNTDLPAQEAMESAVWLYFVAEQLEDTDKQCKTAYAITRLRTVADALSRGNTATNHPAFDQVMKEAAYAPSRSDGEWLTDMVQELESIDIELGGVLHSAIVRLHDFTERLKFLEGEVERRVSSERFTEEVEEKEAAEKELKEMTEKSNGHESRADDLQGQLDEAHEDIRNRDTVDPSPVDALVDAFASYESAGNKTGKQSKFGDYLRDVLSDELQDTASPIRQAVLSVINEALLNGTLGLKKHTDA